MIAPAWATSAQVLESIPEHKLLELLHYFGHTPRVGEFACESGKTTMTRHPFLTAPVLLLDTD